MGPTNLAAFIDIESSPDPLEPVISPPTAVIQRSAGAPTVFELDELAWGSRYNGPGVQHARVQSWFQSPLTGTQTTNTEAQTPRLLLASASSTPHADETAELVQSFFTPYMNRYRVLCACLIYFGNGMTDSAPGALIQYMEKDYHIGYAVVSLIFVAQAIGFISNAFLTDWLDTRLGRARSLMLSELLLVSAYVTIACSPPFGAVVFAYFLVGFGESLNLALNNTFCSNLANSTTVLGCTQGSYGIGGVLGPVLATKLVSSGQVWSRYYFIVLGVSIASLVFAGWAFNGYEQESSVRLQAALQRTARRRVAQDVEEPSKGQLLRQALRNRVTLVGALFIFAYQGAEVSISGWVISFLINYRHGDPSQVGYVTAGFWGGITLGRFVISPFCQRITERLSVYILTLSAIALQLLVWFVPNIVGDAVAVSLIGLFLGPVYPCGQTVFTKLLPGRIQVTSISFISSAGSSGGAVAPFMTGLIAQSAGAWVLHPICIAMFAIMLLAWFCLPDVEKKED